MEMKFDRSHLTSIQKWIHIVGKPCRKICLYRAYLGSYIGIYLILCFLSFFWEDIQNSKIRKRYGLLVLLNCKLLFDKI